jgi:hypothetical protein
MSSKGSHSFRHPDKKFVWVSHHSMHATCLVHLVFLDFILLMILVECTNCEALYFSSVCRYFSQYPAITTFRGVEVDGSWRKLHNDELHNLYSSPNIVRVIKSRRLRWAGHAARMVEVFTGFWLGGPKARGQWGDLCVGGRATLSWTLRR